MKGRWLPSPAMAVALTALVVSVTGGVTAGVLITSADIRDGTIRSVDVRDGTIKSPDVAGGTLTGGDVANGSLTGLDVDESTLGRVPSASRALDAANAGRLDGLDADSFSRVAAVRFSGSLPITTQERSIGDPLSIEAPAAGFVMVHGQTTIETADCTTMCDVSARVRHIEAGAGPAFAHESVDTFEFANLSHAWVFPVDAGVNSFDVMITRFAGDGTVAVRTSSLAAVYSPFGPTGTLALRPDIVAGPRSGAGAVIRHR